MEVSLRALPLHLFARALGMHLELDKPWIAPAEGSIYLHTGCKYIYRKVQYLIPSVHALVRHAWHTASISGASHVRRS